MGMLGGRRFALVSFLLVLLTAGVFWRVLGQGFIYYDDVNYVTENFHVRTGLSVENITWAMRFSYAANWHPLTWVSHMLDCQLYGLKPWGHHFTSLLLHLANTLLLFLVLYRMTGFIWRSAFVAALFAIHPLHVESVAWVAERKDVLSTFFFMLTMLAYYHYTQRSSVRRYLPVVLLYTLGLMSKPMLVTLPFVLLLLDYWPLERCGNREVSGWRRLVLEKVPLFALAAASCIITYIAQQEGGAVGSMQQYPLGVRLANAVVAYASYVLKMLIPRDLAILYPHAGAGLPVWQVVGSSISLILLSVLVVWAARRHPYTLMGWLWYLGTLVPVIGLVQVGMQSMADRYTYVTLIGLFIIAAWGVPDVTDRAIARASSTAARVRSVPLALAATVVVVLVVLAHIQVGYWRDDMTLFKHALDVAQENEVAYVNFGAALADHGRVDEAVTYYKKAIRTAPHYADARVDLGVALASQGKINEAIRQLRIAVRLNPGDAKAHNNLAVALGKLNRVDEAIPHILRALKLRPDYGSAHFNMAVARYKKGSYGSAWDEIRLCRRYGYIPDPGFLKALSRKMPPPRQ